MREAQDNTHTHVKRATMEKPILELSVDAEIKSGQEVCNTLLALLGGQQTQLDRIHRQDTPYWFAENPKGVECWLRTYSPCQDTTTSASTVDKNAYLVVYGRQKRPHEHQNVCIRGFEICKLQKASDIQLLFPEGGRVRPLSEQTQAYLGYYCRIKHMEVMVYQIIEQQQQQPSGAGAWHVKVWTFCTDENVRSTEHRLVEFANHVSPQATW